MNFSALKKAPCLLWINKETTSAWRVYVGEYAIGTLLREKGVYSVYRGKTDKAHEVLCGYCKHLNANEMSVEDTIDALLETEVYGGTHESG